MIGGIRWSVLLKWALVLCLGAAIGYGAAVLNLGPDVAGHGAGRLGTGRVDPAARRLKPQGLSADAASTNESVLRDWVQRVDVYDAAEERIGSTTGLELGSGELLVPATALLEAERALAVGGDGLEVPLGPILATDSVGTLAVLADPREGTRLKPEFESDPGALYLGRELLVAEAGHAVSGWVDSAVIARPDGSEVYRIRVRGKAAQGVGAALIDAATQKMVGVVTSTTAESMVYEAVDAGAIVALLESIPNQTPVEFPEFSRRFFEETPRGMRLRLARLAEQQAWEVLVETARTLLVLDPGAREEISPQVETAYTALAKQALTEGRPLRALELLNEAEEELAPSGARLMLRADVKTDLGDMAGARADLHRAVEIAPALSAVVYPRIRQLVISEVRQTRGSGPVNAGVSLLETEIASDPYYAPYHRLLGEMYYAQGAYDPAIRSLSTAVRLDTSLESQLMPFINTARQRLDTPGYTEVPIQSAGNNIYVDVRLEGAPQTFRFVVDTGATFTGISAQTAQTLGISSTVGMPLLTLNTANGIVHAPVVRLKSIEVGGAVVQGVDAVILDSFDAGDGLLGLSYLDHFSVGVSRDEGKLTLIRR